MRSVEYASPIRCCAQLYSVISKVRRARLFRERLLARNQSPKWGYVLAKQFLFAHMYEKMFSSFSLTSPSNLLVVGGKSLHMRKRPAT